MKRMPDGRIPKDILYGELAEGSRGQRRPLLRYRDVIKRGLNATGVHIRNWEELALDRSRWRTQVQEGVSQAKRRRLDTAEEKRKVRQRKATDEVYTDEFMCQKCGRKCRARIGLVSHSRHCN